MLRNLFISDLHLCVRAHEYGIAIYCLSHKTKKIAIYRLWHLFQNRNGALEYMIKHVR
jgi:hypothetical protein